MSEPTVICMTAVKNEAWILERFLKCASLWADHIVVADQGSTDGTREIARGFEKVRLVENPSEEFNEPERQALLIEEARRIPGPRVLMTLDADEVLSADVLESEAWERALRSPPGTVLEFSRIDLWRSPSRYFFDTVEDTGWWQAFGFVDDGKEYVGRKMHAERVPQGKDAPRVRLEGVVVLHYQFCDPARTASKHRWYRCYERLEFSERPARKIHRIYDWMDRVETPIRPSPEEWLEGYRTQGIDMNTIEESDIFWWDWEVLRMFARHGTEPFRGLDVWDPDWEAIRRRGLAEGVEDLPDAPVRDPRGLRHRLGLWLMRARPPAFLARRVERIAGRLLES